MKKVIFVLAMSLALNSFSFAQDRGGAGGVKGGGSDGAYLYALMWAHPHKSLCEIIKMAIAEKPELLNDEDFSQKAENCGL